MTQGLSSVDEEKNGGFQNVTHERRYDKVLQREGGRQKRKKGERQNRKKRRI